MKNPRETLRKDETNERESEHLIRGKQLQHQWIFLTENKTVIRSKSVKEKVDTSSRGDDDTYY